MEEEKGYTAKRADKMAGEKKTGIMVRKRGQKEVKKTKGACRWKEKGVQVGRKAHTTWKESAYKQKDERTTDKRKGRRRGHKTKTWEKERKRKRTFSLPLPFRRPFHPRSSLHEPLYLLYQLWAIFRRWLYSAIGMGWVACSIVELR